MPLDDPSKYIKTKRRHRFVYDSMGFFPAIYELIRSFIKPRMTLALSVESVPLLYSVSTPESFSSFEEGEYYLALKIKNRFRPIGNFEFNAIGDFSYGNQLEVKKEVLLFESFPEVIEANDEIILKNTTPIDFKSLNLAKSKIQMNLAFDFAYAGKLKTLNKMTRWCFAVNNGVLVSNQLINISS